MRLKGSAKTNRKKQAKSQQVDITKETQAKLEKLEAEYKVVQAEVNTLCGQVRELASRRDEKMSQSLKLRVKVNYLRSYLADLTNKIVPGRWYCFNLGSSDVRCPLIYVTEIRRPKKYTYISFFYVAPATAYELTTQRWVCIDNIYKTLYVEARHDQLANHLREETEQNRMGLLVRWGISENKLLQSLKEAYSDYDKPKRLTANSDLRYSISTLKHVILDLSGKINSGEK